MKIQLLLQQRKKLRSFFNDILVELRFLLLFIMVALIFEAFSEKEFGGWRRGSRTTNQFGQAASRLFV
ncbi:hypothetical protein T05_11581 [Trichinella murrelli]|uniref:Uncharacterized protein n=1 Tax=Trichinella murrelli TaxID=144512 RepID=A0A0V0TG50_9BILA|nr:hypothetical protein T05_11581 [Trichinella murrelli]